MSGQDYRLLPESLGPTAGIAGSQPVYPPGIAHRARLAVAARASDPAECAELLAMLGLDDPEGTVEGQPRPPC